MALCTTSKVTCELWPSTMSSSPRCRRPSPVPRHRASSPRTAPTSAVGAPADPASANVSAEGGPPLDRSSGVAADLKLLRGVAAGCGGLTETLLGTIAYVPRTGDAPGGEVHTAGPLPAVALGI